MKIQLIWISYTYFYIFKNFFNVKTKLIKKKSRKAGTFIYERMFSINKTKVLLVIEDSILDIISFKQRQDRIFDILPDVFVCRIIQC